MLMSMCELHWQRGDLEVADQKAREAIDFATRAGEPVNVGESHVWLGRIAEARGDRAQADADFSAAFELLQDSTERFSQAHALYAEILESRGDLGGAVLHLKQALATRSSDRTQEVAATA